MDAHCCGGPPNHIDPEVQIRGQAQQRFLVDEAWVRVAQADIHATSERCRPKPPESVHWVESVCMVESEDDQHVQVRYHPAADEQQPDKPLFWGTPSNSLVLSQKRIVRDHARLDIKQLVIPSSYARSAEVLPEG